MLIGCLCLFCDPLWIILSILWNHGSARSHATGEKHVLITQKYLLEVRRSFYGRASRSDILELYLWLEMTCGAANGINDHPKTLLGEVFETMTLYLKGWASCSDIGIVLYYE